MLILGCLLSLTRLVLCAKISIGGNETRSCLMVRYLLLFVFYDEGNFFVFRLTHESKVKLYFHTLLLLSFLYLMYKREKQSYYLPSIHSMNCRFPLRESISGYSTPPIQNLLFRKTKHSQPQSNSSIPEVKNQPPHPSVSEHESFRL